MAMREVICEKQSVKNVAKFTNPKGFNLTHGPVIHL